MESNKQATSAVAHAPDALMSTAQVAALTGIPTATLRFWRHTNAGPRSFALGRRVFYRAADVSAWIAAQEAATSRGGVA